MKEYLIEILSAFSRLLNAALGGSADMTFSARCHFLGPRVAELAIDTLFLPFDRGFDHCEKAAEYDLRAARDLIVTYKKPDAP